MKEYRGLYTPSLHFQLSPVDSEHHCYAVTGISLGIPTVASKFWGFFNNLTSLCVFKPKPWSYKDDCKSFLTGTVLKKPEMVVLAVQVSRKHAVKQ